MLLHYLVKFENSQ